MHNYRIENITDVSLFAIFCFINYRFLYFLCFRNFTTQFFKESQFPAKILIGTVNHSIILRFLCDKRPCTQNWLMQQSQFVSCCNYRGQTQVKVQAQFAQPWLLFSRTLSSVSCHLCFGFNLIVAFLKATESFQGNQNMFLPVTMKQDS